MNVDEAPSAEPNVGFFASDSAAPNENVPAGFMAASAVVGIVLNANVLDATGLVLIDAPNAPPLLLPSVFKEAPEPKANGVVCTKSC